MFNMCPLSVLHFSIHSFLSSSYLSYCDSAMVVSSSFLSYSYFFHLSLYAVFSTGYLLRSCTSFAHCTFTPIVPYFVSIVLYAYSIYDRVCCCCCRPYLITLF